MVNVHLPPERWAAFKKAVDEKKARGESTAPKTIEEWEAFYAKTFGKVTVEGPKDGGTVLFTNAGRGLGDDSK